MPTTKSRHAAAGARRIAGLSELAPEYDLLLCDVWGVLHNGLAPFEGTLRALKQFREAGGAVVLITNAPRRRKSVHAQIAAMGVDDASFDGIVTSGDVTRTLIANGPSKVFHIGPQKDLNLFEGIDVERVTEEEAQIVVCSGLWDDRTETPADYTDLLARLAARNLDFICANPDIVVEMGDQTLYCAGAIAQAYAGLGGNTLIAGKPHSPIYDVAIAEAGEMAGKTFGKNRILAIGDGMPTDIIGAENYGIDALFVSSGIHSARYGPADDPDDGALRAFLEESGVDPVAYIPRLDW